jgi:hypothetical protein
MTEQTGSVDAWPLYRRDEIGELGRFQVQDHDRFGEQPDRDLLPPTLAMFRHLLDRQAIEQPGGSARRSGLHMKHSGDRPLERVRSPIGGETPEQSGPYDPSIG